MMAKHIPEMNNNSNDSMFLLSISHLKREIRKISHFGSVLIALVYQCSYSPLIGGVCGHFWSNGFAKNLRWSVIQLQFVQEVWEPRKKNGKFQVSTKKKLHAKNVDFTMKMYPEQSKIQRT